MADARRCPGFISQRVDIKVTGSTEYLAWTVEQARRHVPGATLITVEQVRDRMPLGQTNVIDAGQECGWFKGEMGGQIGG